MPPFDLLAVAFPLAQRPVICAADHQSLAQHIGIHPKGPAQAETFIAGHEAGPQEKIVDHLPYLARTHISQTTDIRSEGTENRAAALEPPAVSANHEKKVPLLGRQGSAHHRSIDHLNGALSRSGRDFPAGL